MKKINFKGKKHAVTAVCLLAGMFVLTSSVYANYDNARGYTNYKEAVKDLILYEDNFSAEGDMSIFVDGEKVAATKATFKVDGKDYYIRTAMEEELSGKGKQYENIQIHQGGKLYYYYPETNSYWISENAEGFRPDMSDPAVKKGIRFVELFADAMVGDLKNNFVLTSKEGDNRTYSVDVSGSQIPEIVHAGLSLVFTASNTADTSAVSYVTYENYEKAFDAYFEEQTGKKVTETSYSESDAEYNQVVEDFSEKYDNILQEKNNKGIVYVKADGSYTYYKTYAEYEKAVQLGNDTAKNMMAMLGSDPYIDRAFNSFTLDKNGKLLTEQSEASMTGVDSKGTKHTITMKVNYKVSDYGATKIEAFDTTGKTKEN
ncbi:hypothetical protein [Aminipila sp.]|uniref:hypothetical protein n=2 Tax=Aminipila sp. TaxID=2060095 RepID=UPI0028A0F807|nr:hypothetical protein [Aminipila sp.]